MKIIIVYREYMNDLRDVFDKLRGELSKKYFISTNTHSNRLYNIFIPNIFNIVFYCKDDDMDMISILYNPIYAYNSDSSRIIPYLKKCNTQPIYHKDLDDIIIEVEKLINEEQTITTDTVIKTLDKTTVKDSTTEPVKASNGLSKEYIALEMLKIWCDVDPRGRSTRDNILSLYEYFLNGLKKVKESED